MLHDDEPSATFHEVKVQLQQSLSPSLIANEVMDTGGAALFINKLKHL